VHQVRRKDNSEDSFYEKRFPSFSKVPHEYSGRRLSAKLRRKDTFKPTIGNDSLLQVSNDNGVRVVNSATLKNLVIKSTMFLHHNIRKFTWISPVGKNHHQTDYILIDRRWHSIILNVRSFRGADCDTDYYLMVAKVRERLAVSRQAAQSFKWKDLISEN
jgi:hypothetical protein